MKSGIHCDITGLCRHSNVLKCAPGGARWTQTLRAHLAEAAFAQHHQEVKVSQLHAVLVAVGVKAGCSVGPLALCVLAWTDLSPLNERK